MPVVLLLQPLLERLHDLVPRAEGLDRGHFLGAEEFFGDGAQPVFGNIDGALAIVGEHAFEDLGEHLVEAV